MKEHADVAKQNAHVLELLKKQAERQGHSREQLAHALGISYQRLNQYERGHARVADAKKDTLAAISRYLEIPIIWVMLITGLISETELVWPGDEQKKRLELALSHMRADPWLGPMIPEEIDESALRVQEFVVMLYRILRANGLVADTAYRPITGLNNFNQG